MVPARRLLAERQPDDVAVQAPAGREVPQRGALQRRGRQVHHRPAHHQGRPSGLRRLRHHRAAEVVDPYTINVVTSKPDPILVKRFAGYGGQMLPPQYLKQVDWKDFALKPVGTGPYKFVEWVKDDRVVLEANDAYWRGAPRSRRSCGGPLPATSPWRWRTDSRRGPADHQGAPGPCAAAGEGRVLPGEHAKTNPADRVLDQREEGPARQHEGAPGSELRGQQGQDHQGSGTTATRSRSAAASPTTPTFRFNSGIEPYPYYLGDMARSSSRRPARPTRAASASLSPPATASTLNDRQLTEAVAADARRGWGFRAKVGGAQLSDAVPASPGPTPSRPPARRSREHDALTEHPRARVAFSMAPGGIVTKIWPGRLRGAPAPTSLWRRRASAWTPRSGSRLRRGRADLARRGGGGFFSRASCAFDAARNEIVYKARGDQRIIGDDIGLPGPVHARVGRPARPTPAGTAGRRDREDHPRR